MAAKPSEKDLYILTRMRGWRRNWSVGFEETTGMVSNALKMSQDELLDALEQLRKKFANTPEYKKLRQDLPKDWPLWLVI